MNAFNYLGQIVIIDKLLANIYCLEKKCFKNVFYIYIKKITYLQGDYYEYRY